MNDLSPIVLFVYNRPWHTKQTVEALQKNELANKSELFIYCDNAKNKGAQKSVDEVRNFVKNIKGFKKITIIKRKRNWGLACSIIDGVTKIVNEYGKIIVLEDDLVTSPYFLEFMNDGLKMYKDDLKVASIHGYIYPIKSLPDTFFIKGADCWGWATWKNRWSVFEPNGRMLLNDLKSRKLKKEVNFNNSFDYTKMLKDQIQGKNNSWAIRWYVSAFLKNMLTLYPGKSLVQNIGFDNSGSHCGFTEIFLVEINNGVISNNKIKIIEDVDSRKKMEIFFRSTKGGVFQRVKSKIKRIILIKKIKDV
jgi:hypothetical protein